MRRREFHHTFRRRGVMAARCACAAGGTPVGSGFVAGLPRPGGNITGFTNVEASLGGKCGSSH